MRTKKGTGIIGYVFFVLLFLLMWGVWLGSWIASVGQYAIEHNNLTGIEAFGFANLNLIVFICLVLGIMAYSYFGGGQQ